MHDHVNVNVHELHPDTAAGVDVDVIVDVDVHVDVIGFFIWLSRGCSFTKSEIHRFL